MEILDLLIMGAGPAGMTAAIYASRTNLNFKIIDKLAPGGQMIKTDIIDNYPGFPKISGAELSLKLTDHLKTFGVNIYYDEVIKIEKEKQNLFKIDTKSGKNYLAKKIIIATGVKPKKLNITGEEKFFGKGLSYCSTCDGYFYKDKTIAVIGKGKSALVNSIYLSKIAKKVYLINKDGEFKNNGPIIDEIKKIKNIEIKYFAKTKEILGNGKIEAILLNYPQKAEKNSKKEEILKIDGVFVFVGNIPNTIEFKDMINLSEKGEIIVDENFETSQKGIYAVRRCY